jgi:hypothetical protein
MDTKDITKWDDLGALHTSGLTNAASAGICSVAPLRCSIARLFQYIQQVSSRCDILRVESILCGRIPALLIAQTEA